MQGAATLFGHPIHPMLVPFPIAFFLGALACDVIYVIWKRPSWRTAAFAMIGFGLLGGLAAATAGLTDYLTAHMSAEAKDIATDHLTTNLILMGVFVANFILRWKRPGLWLAYALSLIGAGLVLWSGWLGGKLVFEFSLGMKGG